VDYPVNGTYLHGPGGLGGLTFPSADLHHPHPSDKLIVDEIHRFPGEVTVVVLGPLTALASAMEREAELPRLVRQLIILGGSLHEPGDASAVAEFHFFCDPLAAKHVIRSGAPITLIPLDSMRKALFSPTELTTIPSGESKVCQLLRSIVPFGVSAMAQHYGIEGFHLSDVLGTCALAVPKVFKTKPMTVDVETRGELTRGMSVFDLWPPRAAKPNVDLVVDVDMDVVRNYMAGVFAGIHT
jgi:purine nucleosidase